MGRWEHRYLGWDRFPDPSTPIEIEQLFTLESDELACARARRTPLLPRSCETFLRHLEAAVSAGLEAVAEAVADGAVTIRRTAPAPRSRGTGLLERSWQGAGDRPRHARCCAAIR